MPPPTDPKRKNDHDFSQPWQRQVMDLCRPIFEDVGYRLPENMKGEIGFTSGGKKSKATGEWIGPDATGGYHEIIVRSSIDDPYEIVCVMMEQFIFAIIGRPERNKAYRDIALSINMDVSNGLRNMRPKAVLQKRLNAIVEAVGPIPHNAIDYDRVRVNGASTLKPKQTSRQLKAECIFIEAEVRCGYLVRVSAGQAREIGPPHCPKHGAMYIHWPDGEEPDQPVTGPDGPIIDGTAEEVPDRPQLPAAAE